MLPKIANDCNKISKFFSVWDQEVTVFLNELQHCNSVFSPQYKITVKSAYKKPAYNEIPVLRN